MNIVDVVSTVQVFNSLISSVVLWKMCSLFLQTAAMGITFVFMRPLSSIFYQHLNNRHIRTISRTFKVGCCCFFKRST